MTSDIKKCQTYFAPLYSYPRFLEQNITYLDNFKWIYRYLSVLKMIILPCLRDDFYRFTKCFHIDLFHKNSQNIFEMRNKNQISKLKFHRKIIARRFDWRKDDIRNYFPEIKFWIPKKKKHIFLEKHRQTWIRELTMQLYSKSRRHRWKRSCRFCANCVSSYSLLAHPINSSTEMHEIGKEK